MYFRVKRTGSYAYLQLVESFRQQGRVQQRVLNTVGRLDGHPRQFTWRTIQTWYSRYQKHGVTVMENQPRSDKGKVRKVALEDLLESLRKVQPKAHGKTPTLALL
jgi:transposase